MKHNGKSQCQNFIVKCMKVTKTVMIILVCHQLWLHCGRCWWEQCVVIYLTLYSELSQVFLIAGVPPGVQWVEGQLPRPSRHVATFVWWARHRRQTVSVFTGINFIVKDVTHNVCSVTGCNLVYFHLFQCLFITCAAQRMATLQMFQCSYWMEWKLL